MTSWVGGCSGTGTTQPCAGVTRTAEGDPRPEATRPGPPPKHLARNAIGRLARVTHGVVIRYPFLWGPAGRVSRFVTSSSRLGPLRRVLSPLRDLLRGSMRPQDVLLVLDALESHDVPYWVAGGWGVDILLGRQTRSHDDLDIVIGDYSTNLPTALQSLVPLGYGFSDAFERRTWMPRAVVVDDGAGRRVDLVSISWDLLESAFSQEDPTQDELEHLTFGHGTIGNRTVPCLSGTVQLLYHSRFELTQEGRHDVALMERELGVGLPHSDTA